MITKLAEIFFSFHHFHHLAGLMYVYYCRRLLSYLFVVMKCRYIVKPKAIYGLGADLIRSRAKRLTVMMGGHIWDYDTRTLLEVGGERQSIHKTYWYKDMHLLNQRIHL